MIYFIKAGKFIKIGYTKNKDTFKVRLQSYHTSNPYIIETLKLMEGDVNLEKDILEYFNKYHEKGEWFNYNEEIINYINNPFTLPISKFFKPTNKSSKIIKDNLNNIIKEYCEGNSLKVLSEKYNVNRARLSKHIPKELKRKKNGWFSLKKRKNHPRNKKIICVENSIIYDSIAEASRQLNIPKACIIKVCKGTRIKAHKLTFKYSK
jgi:hypothetical protein